MRVFVSVCVLLGKLLRAVSGVSVFNLYVNSGYIIAIHSGCSDFISALCVHGSGGAMTVAQMTALYLLLVFCPSLLRARLGCHKCT